MTTQKTLIIPTILAVMIALPSTAAAICTDEYTCGSNSPEVDHHGLHALNLKGIPNEDHISFVRFAKGTQIYQLSVVNGHIRGTAKGLPVLEGDALKDAYLVLSRPGGLLYKVTIAGVGTATFASDPKLPIETYLFVWAAFNSPLEPTNICVAPPAPPVVPIDEAGDWDPIAQRSSMLRTHTLLFEGDVIHAATKTIEPTPDVDWFNFGCAGHTLAKLHLTHNTAISRTGTPSATWAARQAVLKMLVADYCGDGTPFTVFGEPLVWKDDDTMSYFATPGPFEARWTANGPGCLDVPRVLANPTAQALDKFPDIEAAIAAHCTRPQPCYLPDPNPPQSEPVHSANR